MKIEEKLWDSKVLGARCGKVLYNPYDTAIDFDGWDFLHARPGVDEGNFTAILKEKGFLNIAGHMLLSRDLHAHPPAISGIDFPYREATKNDAAYVGGLAGQIFSHDRFHADKRIPQKMADAYKRAWGENLCRGYAEKVFVATDRHRGVIGFSSIRGSFVGLNGVHPKFRRRRIGSGLVELACKRLADLGNHYALTSTQRSNMPALNMYYGKCHFKIQGMAIDFHWIRPGLEWK